jgi:protein-S-isoprenylcysteine O-methyltransferase Ste14
MLEAARAILFVVGTIVLLLVSRRSLLRPASHGFYRFWAWETLLALFVLNLAGWLADPLSWHQLASWTLLAVSLVLVIAGLRLLHRNGEQNPARNDPSLLSMERTSRLVTSGLYHHIRHPLYSSLLFLAWGMFFKSPSWLDAALAALCSCFLVATARIEERENLDYFGEEYAEYMRRSKMFIPFVL